MQGWYLAKQGGANRAREVVIPISFARRTPAMEKADSSLRSE
jgi:hypothetical protein